MLLRANSRKFWVAPHIPQKPVLLQKVMKEDYLQEVNLLQDI